MKRSCARSAPTSSSITNWVRRKTAVRDVDLVLDTVGGPDTGRFLAALAPGGALFPVFPLGFTGADDAAARGLTVSSTQVRSNGVQLAAIGALMARGYCAST